MRLLIIVLIFINVSVFGQKYGGFVFNSTDKKPIAFVNIGVVGKDIGTISSESGKYDLSIDDKFDNDTIRFSCVGYKNYASSILDYRKLIDKNILLDEIPVELKEVIIVPKTFKDRTLGNRSHSKIFTTGFEENRLGYEMGVILKIKKTAVLTGLNLNVNYCSFDTIFYRINLYKVTDNFEFGNILTKPIYVKIPKGQIKDRISVDLSKENIHVEGNCLVTIEQIKDLGRGFVWFSAVFPGKTYYRKTSQGVWATTPIGISLSVDAKIEE